MKEDAEKYTETATNQTIKISSSARMIWAERDNTMDAPGDARISYVQIEMVRGQYQVKESNGVIKTYTNTVDEFGNCCFESGGRQFSISQVSRFILERMMTF